MMPWRGAAVRMSRFLSSTSGYTKIDRVTAGAFATKAPTISLMLPALCRKRERITRSNRRPSRPLGRATSISAMKRSAVLGTLGAISSSFLLRASQRISRSLLCQLDDERVLVVLLHASTARHRATDDGFEQLRVDVAHGFERHDGDAVVVAEERHIANAVHGEERAVERHEVNAAP